MAIRRESCIAATGAISLVQVQSPGPRIRPTSKHNLSRHPSRIITECEINAGLALAAM
jgi:hypothetical protein